MKNAPPQSSEAFKGCAVRPDIIAVVRGQYVGLEIKGADGRQSEDRRKSGGFRVAILYRRGSRAFFVHGFAKSERANISQDELVALKELASEMLAHDEAEITKAIESGAFIEVICHE